MWRNFGLQQGKHARRTHALGRLAILAQEREEVKGAAHTAKQRVFWLPAKLSSFFILEDDGQ